jgi:hypothetical protein
MSAQPSAVPHDRRANFAKIAPMNDVNQNALAKAEEAIRRILIDLSGELYSDARVLDELARLSQHTCGEVQARIQSLYMWMQARNASPEAK